MLILAGGFASLARESEQFAGQIVDLRRFQPQPHLLAAAHGVVQLPARMSVVLGGDEGCTQIHRAVNRIIFRVQKFGLLHGRAQFGDRRLCSSLGQRHSR